jgi:two-component system, chemotaxis family, chemotaxis protein CheY
MPIRILIADDNPTVRAAMREVLAGSGEWEIIEAENGKEAVTKSHELRPDLVILDLVMPDKDGLAASREIAQFLPGTPILMHTLYSSPEIQIEAAKTGVRKVVPKTHAAGLISAVQDALRDPGKTPEVMPASPPSNSDQRRLEDKIRELCQEAISTRDDAELAPALTQLREALSQHVEQSRARLIEFPGVSERRIRNGDPHHDSAINSGLPDNPTKTEKARRVANGLPPDASPKASNGT